MNSNQKEERILEYIKEFMVKNGYTPTVREICEGVGLSSSSSVQRYMERLVSKGEIEQHGRNYSVRGMKYVDMSVL